MKSWNQSRKSVLIVQGWLLYNKKTGSWYLIFSLQGWGVSFIDKTSPDHKPDCICTESRVSLSLPALNPSAHFFVLLVNVAFSLQNMVPLCELKTLRFSWWHLRTCLLLLGGQKLLLLLFWLLLAKLLYQIIKPSFAGIKFSSFRFFTFCLH